MEKERPVVLHVEDDESDARMVVRGFASARCQVDIVHAIDGRIATEMIDEIALGNRQIPDLILLDLKLPFASGFELLTRARAVVALADVPIVILTSSNLEDDRVRGHALGCTDYLVKPFDYHEFKSLVRDIAERYLNSAIGYETTEVTVL